MINFNSIGVKELKNSKVHLNGNPATQKSSFKIDIKEIIDMENNL